MRLQIASSETTMTYVFDLDGVIYRGAELQPMAREVVLALRDQGHNVRFFTNNSALSRVSYQIKLEALGIPTAIEDIMTSSYATALYFIEIGALGKTVYKIGEIGITEELEAVGMKVIENDDKPGAKIDYVVVGMDRYFHYGKLERAQQAILDGAKFIATNEDATFPVEGGRLMPGGGCMVAAVRTATSVEPFVVGKPHTYALEKILEMTGTPPDRTVMIGDRLDTDIAVGNRAGAHSVLVLTGVSTAEDAAKAVGELKPKSVIPSLAELIK